MFGKTRLLASIEASTIILSSFSPELFLFTEINYSNRIPGSRFNQNRVLSFSEPLALSASSHGLANTHMIYDDDDEDHEYGDDQVYFLLSRLENG